MYLCKGVYIGMRAGYTPCNSYMKQIAHDVKGTAEKQQQKKKNMTALIPGCFAWKYFFFICFYYVQHPARNTRDNIYLFFLFLVKEFKSYP